MRQHTSLRVGHYCGEMNVDLWGEVQWRLLFDKLDVIVMTAQILLDLLVHGYLSLQDVALLIFDECHHARKRHPYNVIMAEFYYSLDKQDRPRIFGMSATPVNRKEEVNVSVWQLEVNLDSKAFTVSRNNDAQLLEAAPKPIEKILEYPSAALQLPGPILEIMIKFAQSSGNAQLTTLSSRL